MIFSRGHATLHLSVSVGRSVGQSVRPSVRHIFEFRAVFALLLLPNRPRLDCRVSGLVFFFFFFFFLLSFFFLFCHLPLSSSLFFFPLLFFPSLFSFFLHFSLFSPSPSPFFLLSPQSARPPKARGLRLSLISLLVDRAQSLLLDSALPN